MDYKIMEHIVVVRTDINSIKTLVGQVVTLVEHLNSYLPETAPKLKTVPVIYRGPWQGRAAHKHLAEGPSVIGDGACIREGVVIRPAKERFTDRIGRTILKMVGESYLVRKSS